jgi:hypothetical protein
MSKSHSVVCCETCNGVRLRLLTAATSGHIVHNQMIYEYGERRWNDRVKPKNSQRNLSQCHFVHHKSHMDWPGVNPGLRCERPATNRLSHSTALLGRYTHSLCAPPANRKDRHRRRRPRFGWFCSFKVTCPRQLQQLVVRFVSLSVYNPPS